MLDLSDTLVHVFECCTGMQPLKQWTNKALHMLAHWTPPADKGYAKFLVYGRTTHTPVDATIRGVALDTIRMMRAVRTSQYHDGACRRRQGAHPAGMAGVLGDGTVIVDGLVAEIL